MELAGLEPAPSWVRFRRADRRSSCLVVIGLPMRVSHSSALRLFAAIRDGYLTKT
jgi:hypothetical protein